MRKFKYNNLNGLFFNIIPLNKVNTDLTDVEEGDYFQSTNGDFLMYSQEGFRIVTDDPQSYFSSKDLKEGFVNCRLEISNRV